jgi:hypothetical protein
LECPHRAPRSCPRSTSEVVRPHKTPG